MNRTVEVYIDELVLHGFTGYHTGQIGDAVQQEITRLLQERGLPPAFSRNVELERLSAGNVTLRSGSKAGTIGNNIANSVYQSLQNGQSQFSKNGK